MGHGKALSSPMRTPTTVKDYRRIAGRMQERARYLKQNRAGAPLSETMRLYDEAAMAERNAALILDVIRGLPDNHPLELSPSLK